MHFGKMLVEILSAVEIGPDGRLRVQEERLPQIRVTRREDLSGGEEQEKLLTPREVAALEGVSPRTVSNRCAQGEYRDAFRTNGDSGHWRIPSRSVRDRRYAPTAHRPYSPLQTVPDHLRDMEAEND